MTLKLKFWEPPSGIPQSKCIFFFVVYDNVLSVTCCELQVPTRAPVVIENPIGLTPVTSTDSTHMNEIPIVGAQSFVVPKDQYSYPGLPSFGTPQLAAPSHKQRALQKFSKSVIVSNVGAAIPRHPLPEGVNYRVKRDPQRTPNTQAKYRSYLVEYHKPYLQPWWPSEWL